MPQRNLQPPIKNYSKVILQLAYTNKMYHKDIDTLVSLEQLPSSISLLIIVNQK